MKKKIWGCIILLVLSYSMKTRAQSPSIFEEARYGILKIRANWGEADDEFGTGMVISSTAVNIVILTNRHVIARKSENEIRWKKAPEVWITPFGQLEEIQIDKKDILYFNDEEDLAILKVNRQLVPNVKILSLSEKFLHDGTRVYALSFPIAKARPQITPGFIESRENPFYNIVFEVSDRSVMGGESGSPLLNERATVVGIITEKFVSMGAVFNRVLHSKQVRSYLQRYNLSLPSPPENQMLAVPPLDFDPPQKQRKWSNKFIKHFKEFFSTSHDIFVVTEGDLAYQYYRRFIHDEEYHNLRDLYKIPSYLVTGWGRKIGKIYQIEISLELFPSEQVVWSKRIEAKDLRSLADSAGFNLAHYFGYRTKFTGVAHGLRKTSLTTTVLGVLTTPLLWHTATESKNDYVDALTTQTARSNYKNLHRNEIVRNSATIFTTFSLCFWMNATFINPRKTVFEKKEVNHVTSKN